VADWYDKLVGDDGSEYHQKVIFPGVLRMLAPKPGDAVLDVACGQGALARQLHAKGAAVVGVDAAEPLVRAAVERGPADVAYHVGDVRELERMPFVGAGRFASAACVLAIQNIHPIAPVFAGVAKALRPMGRLALVMMHPCFRGPKETSWGWDPETGAQYRRVDRYLVPRKEPIVTHPAATPGRTRGRSTSRSRRTSGRSAGPGCWSTRWRSGRATRRASPARGRWPRTRPGRRSRCF
jgi:ubiquinone/menaquinone biosynthesis C-methylase UbiE